MTIKQFLFVDSDGFYTEGHVEGNTIIRNCDSNLAVGDLVMESDSIANGVDKVSSNTDKRSVIGYCISKPTATTAEIMTKGVIDGLSGLTKGSKVYLGTDGGFTSTKPAKGYIHVLGHAVEDDKIDFDPVNTKIKLYYEGLTFPLVKSTITQSSTTYFGHAVATDGNTLVIGDFGYNSNQGKVYVYAWNEANKQWEYETELTASDGASGDYFGHHVDVDGDTIIVGAGLKDDASNTDVGAAYTFVKSGGTWSEDIKYDSPGGSDSIYFGYMVHIDDSKVYIGAPYYDSNGYSNNGAIFVYERGSSTLYDTIDGPSDGSNYGNVFTIFNNKLAVKKGSYDIDLYEDSGTEYSYNDTISPSGRVGTTQGLSYVNDTTFLTGVENITNSAGNSSGVVKCYRYDGSSWSEDSSYIAEPENGGADGDFFGRAISYKDGILVVGATSNDDGASNAGSVYIFEDNGSGWTQVQQYAHDVSTAGIPKDYLAHDDHGVYISDKTGNELITLMKA